MADGQTTKEIYLRDILNNTPYQPEYIQLPEVKLQPEDEYLEKIETTKEETMATGPASPFKLESFSGLQCENAVSWLKRFQAWARLSGWTEEQAIEAFRLSLTGPAEVWYEALPETEPPKDEPTPSRHDLEAAYAAFQDKYTSTGSWLKENQLLRRKQGKTESVEAYAAAMRQLMAQLNKSPRDMLSLFVNGLRDKRRRRLAMVWGDRSRDSAR